MSSPALPTFLILGAQKSGTRWLRKNLGLHRSVFTVEREVEFFNHHFDEGIDWYRSQFAGWSGEPVLGEATPGYMFHVEDPALMAQRILATLGEDVALIAVLRDPIERARSSYVHHLRRGRIDPEIDPIEFLAALDPDTDELGVISGGWYGRSLAPFAKRFDRLLVEFHADIDRQGEEMFVRVLEHIGVDDPWVPGAMHEVVFSGVGQVAKKFPHHPILELDAEEIRAVVGASFDEDAELLEALIGRPAPWRIEAAPKLDAVDPVGAADQVAS